MNLNNHVAMRRCQSETTWPALIVQIVVNDVRKLEL